MTPAVGAVFRRDLVASGIEWLTGVVGLVLRSIRIGVGANQAGAVLRQRSSVRLTPVHSLHWVETGDERLLVSCHPGGLKVIRRSAAAGSGREAPGQETGADRPERRRETRLGQERQSEES